MNALMQLLTSLGGESLLKLGLIIIDAAREVCAAEGMSAEQFAAKRAEIEGARGKAIDEALAQLKGVLK